MDDATSELKRGPTMGCPPSSIQNLFSIYLAPPSLPEPSPLSQPTCQDGLVHPEGGGFDGEDADVCRDFVPHCRERGEFSWEWSFLSSQSLSPSHHPSFRPYSIQPFTGLQHESPHSITTPQTLSCCPPLNASLPTGCKPERGSSHDP